MKLLTSLVPALAILAAVFVAVCGILLLALAVTAAGRLAGVGLVVAAAGALFAGLGVGWSGRFLRMSMWRMAGIHVACALVLLGVCYRLSPDGSGGGAAEAGFRSVWNGGFEFVRASPANVIPEVDQVMVALFALPYLDQTVTSDDVTALRSIFLRLYREVGNEPDFRRAGSALGEAYRELAGAPVRPGHAFVYVPPSGGGEGSAADGAAAPVPAMVVLHPEGGNLRATLRPWIETAERHGLAVVAPTCGSGQWIGEAATASLDLAMALCRDDPRIDAGQVTLVGIGEGAAAIPQLVAGRPPEEIRRVVLIPSGAEAVVLEDPEFAALWSGRHALIMHGEEDLRLPVADVERGAEWLESRGVKVSLVTFPDGDHFLPWLQGGAVLREVSAWLGRS